MLQRLEAKGFVVSDKSGLAHVFRPAVTRDKLLRDRLKDLANQLPAGAERDSLLRRARLAETSAHISDWLKSPGLQAPK